MTNRENLMELIKFGNPERIVTYIPEYALYYRGCHHDDSEGRGHHSPVGTVWKDIWGVEWHKDLEDVMGFPKGNPLSDLELLDSFTFPDADDIGIYGNIFDLKKGFSGNDVFISGSHRDTLWERAYMLVGMENMMEYFYTEPLLVKRLLHRITDFNIKMAQHYIDAGVELVYFGDDHGTQSSLLLGMEIFKEFFLPEYERLFDFYKDKNVIKNFHSCGHIEPLLDMFIYLGVDILNPVQASANNLENVIKKTQGKMALQGAVSSEVLMKGTKEDIVNAVKNAISVLGKKGGYICTADQHMPYTQESIDIMNAAVQRYGKY